MQEAPTRVLLVESDGGARAATVHLLQFQQAVQHEVCTCSSGLEALQRLEEGAPNEFDLLLVGKLAPQDISVEELLRRVGQPGLRHLPTVVVMEEREAGPGATLKLLRAGAADVVFAPLRRNEAATLWQHAWRRRAARAQRSLLELPCPGDALQQAPLQAPQQQEQEKKPLRGEKSPRPGCSAAASGEESAHPSDASSCSALRGDVASALLKAQPPHVAPPQGCPQGTAAKPQPQQVQPQQEQEQQQPQLQPQQPQQQPALRAASSGGASSSGLSLEAEEQQRQRSLSKAFSDSLESFRLALRQPALPPPVQLGIRPLDLHLEPSATLQGGTLQGMPSGDAVQHHPPAPAQPQGPLSSLLASMAAGQKATGDDCKPLGGSRKPPGDDLLRLASLASTLSSGGPQGVLRSQGKGAPRAERPPLQGAAQPAGGGCGGTWDGEISSIQALLPAKRAASSAAPHCAAAKRAAPAYPPKTLNPSRPRATTQQSAAPLEQAGGPQQWRANRQAAIERWKEKRAQRTFTKTVRYASRQRLAAARPRVRGQFVKASASPVEAC